MDSTETIRTMRENLAEIEKIFAWMEKSGEINQIDIDVLLGKTRHLYNHMLNLSAGRIDTETAAEAIPEPEIPLPDPVIPVAEPVMPVPEPVMTIPEPVMTLPEPVMTIPEPVMTIPEPVMAMPEPVMPLPEPIMPLPEPARPVPEPEPLPSARPPQSQQPPQSQPQQSQQPQPSQLLFQQLFPPVMEPKPKQAPASQQDNSLNQALGKQKPVHDVASSITDIPVSDIWSAITINQRFLFIRELFGNDPERFKNTVTLLNGLESWETARQFMADHFDWDKNNPVATDFLHVVRRRFLK